MLQGPHAIYTVSIHLDTTCADAVHTGTVYKQDVYDYAVKSITLLTTMLSPRSLFTIILSTVGSSMD